MAFHIDITYTRDVALDGTPLAAFEETETGYSLDDCVRQGWYDPATDIWMRRELAVDPYWVDDSGGFLVEEAVDPSGATRRPDPEYGRALGLVPVQKDGRWFHQASPDLLLG